MRTGLPIIVCACLLTTITLAQPSAGISDHFWSQWRGPHGTGVAPHASPPTHWSDSKNIRWKVELPGYGHATPIVWDDRIYIQTAIETEQAASEAAKKNAPTRVHEFMILALDRSSGKTLWEKTLREVVPHESGHRDASQASNSPATDGEHIIAYFGSRGLYCLDTKGEIVWQKELGSMQTRRGFGEGSSPALYRDTVIVTWDHEDQSFIIALDKKTGEPRWRHDRDEPTSWATPVVVEVNGKPQVVASATNQIRGYDLATGELLWQCSGMTGNVIPTPVAEKDLILCTSGFRGSALLAIRYADARGDIAGTKAIAWEYDGTGTPYVPSPLLYCGTLYFLQANRAVLSCVAAETGKPHYIKQRLDGLEDAYASPVAADGRVYVVSRNGATAVLEHGPTFKLLATNTLDESFSASPAVVGKEIYLRGRKYLYCIAED